MSRSAKRHVDEMEEHQKNLQKHSIFGYQLKARVKGCDDKAKK
jgi:hypothetical protein